MSDQLECLDATRVRQGTITPSDRRITAWIEEKDDAVELHVKYLDTGAVFVATFNDEDQPA